MTTLSSSFEQSQDSHATEPEYHSAKQLPVAVWDQCIIYFEESLHLQALTLLNDTVLAGLPAIQKEQNSVFVPPPFILAFASTLSVHPILTTRASSSEALDAANSALDLLRNSFTLAGPLNAEAAEALVFAEQADAITRTSGLPPARSKRRSDVSTSQNRFDLGDEEEYAINARLAKESSVWASAEDFWHVVGWAFNCSTHHPMRWERWQPWLDMMVQTLEQDWKARVKVYKSTDSNSRTKTILKGSVIMQYLLGAKVSGASPGGRRRILRAILANGDEQSLREFRQVFKDEIKEKRKRDIHEFISKSRKLDLEQGDFGDFGDDEDEDDLGSEEEILAQHDSLIKQENNGGVRRKRRSGRGASTTDSGVTAPPVQLPTSRTGYGDVDAWLLRRRLIFLLTLVPDHLQNEFASHEEIYDVLTEFIRPLPLPIFTFMIAPTPDNPARASVLASWLKWLLYSLGMGPRDESTYVDQSVMQKYYLPYAARHNTLVDNVRMAVTLEALVRLLQNTSKLRPGQGFREAVETGIAARSKKAEAAASYGAKAGTTDTEELWVWLRSAEDGLRTMANEAEDEETSMIT